MMAAVPTTLAGDTAAAAERVLIRLYRRMSPAQKLHAICELQRAADTIALAGIRSRHPGIAEPEARLRLTALKLPRKTMVAAFGWDPEVRGY